MLKDVGMAVPKTTATRCRDGSVRARHVMQTQVTPSLHLFFIPDMILQAMHAIRLLRIAVSSKKEM